MSLRIIGGHHSGARLRVPPIGDLRPTLDRVRETVFNILLHRFLDGDLTDVRAVDLFAGSGAYGFEALSRGAEHVIFVDTRDAALATIRANAASLAETARVTVLKRDARALGNPPAGGSTARASLAFLDPPYGRDLAPPALACLAARGWLETGAICVVETAARDSFQVPAGFTCLDQRVMSLGKITFLAFDAG